MKNIKIITTLSSLSLLPITTIGLSSCSSSKPVDEVHISIMSDIHGELPGYGDDFFNSSTTYPGAIRTVQEIQQIQKNYPGSVTLCCGDQNGSGTFSTCAKGDTMYPVLSAMNVPYSAVGNHAWDFGSEKLPLFDQLGRTKDTKGSYFVTSNVLNDKALRDKTWVYKKDQSGFDTDYSLWKKQRVKWADPYKVIDMGGHNVALIGLTTKVATKDSAKAETDNLAFADYIACIYYTKYLMQEELGNDYNKIDAFVALTHVEVGKNDDGSLKGSAYELCKELDTNIDLFLCGHWHQDVVSKVHNDKLDKDIPIMQTAAHMETFNDATLTFDNSKPVGKRLKNIEVKSIRPTINYGGYAPGTEEARNAAGKQLLDIINNPANDIVKNTCLEYSKQKNIAVDKLQEVLGKSNDGFKYDIFEKWDHHYGNTGVEQTGMLVAKSNPVGLSILHNKEISEGKMVKPSIGIISNDSIRGNIPKGNVTLKDVYNIYAFDNKPVYFSLTYFQLEQVVKYILAGNSKVVSANGSVKASNPSNDYYTEKLYYKEGVELPYEDIGDIAFTYCPAQFAGFAFNVTAKTENGLTTYTYNDGSLRIYDPDSGKDFDDIDAYKGKTDWEGKLIVGVAANFTYNDGNNQFKMIKRFAEYNDKSNEDKYKVRTFDEDMRPLVVETIKDMQAKNGHVDISIDVLNKMFNGF